MNIEKKSLADIKRTYKEIKTDKLEIGKSQMRTTSTDTGIEELAENISKVGLIEPIVVFKSGTKYEIVAGQRRFLACLGLDWETIPCMVMDSPPKDDFDALALSMAENFMRLEPSERERIDACTKLYMHYGSFKAVSEATGLPSKRVSQYVKGAQLSSEMKRMVQDGKLALASALAAADAGNLDDGKSEDLTIKIAQTISDEKMTPSHAKRFAKKVKAVANKDGAESLSEEEFTKAMERQTSGKTISIRLSSQIDDGLSSFATESGTDKPDAGGILITEGLMAKGYVPEDI